MIPTPPAKSGRSACYTVWMVCLYVFLALGLALLAMGMLAGQPPTLPFYALTA